MSSSSSKNNSPNSSKNNQDIIDLQKQSSAGFKSSQDDAAKGNLESTSPEEFLKHQQAVFDKMSPWFADSDKEVPPELVPIYEHLGNQMVSEMMGNIKRGVDNRNGRDLGADPEDVPKEYKLLDVACGTGVLWKYLLEAANERGIHLSIEAVDLSGEMVALAKQNAENILRHPEYSTHKISVTQSDVLSYAQEQQEMKQGYYHGAIINAAFGNFWDSQEVLAALTPLLQVDGTLAVSHPLGAEFVQQLHDEEPSTVPHTLPATEHAWIQLFHGLSLVGQSFDRTVELGEETANYYFASARKSRAKRLETMIRLRGPIASGYGRGGKKLGVPTANLPSSLFETALEDVSTGVYLGWAILEGSEAPGRGVPHKAVVNVGYSPTFEGQENPEKIVEAHLILSQDTVLSDFYGETMRLQLAGFLRPEQKFPSFPELLFQIKTDVADAKDALDDKPYIWLRDDEFISNSSGNWIGVSGGDAAASWEFEDMSVCLESRSDGAHNP